MEKSSDKSPETMADEGDDMLLFSDESATGDLLALAAAVVSDIFEIKVEERENGGR